jgi:hypothetical protein
MKAQQNIPFKINTSNLSTVTIGVKWGGSMPPNTFLTEEYFIWLQN